MKNPKDIIEVGIANGGVLGLSLTNINQSSFISFYIISNNFYSL